VISICYDSDTERNSMASESNRQATEPNTGTLLLWAFRSFEAELLEGLAADGYVIRAKHGSVLANVDAEGTRLTELARRAGIGKPAVSELVDELETMGYVERVGDPTDGRAKLVIPTETGVDLIEKAGSVIAAIEGRYRTSLGPDAYQRLRAALKVLAPNEAADVQPRIGFDPL
jgi:DNA-binding MarR family transcriptional regulator